MKQEEKQLQQALGRYVPPALEVVHLQVERGYATSVPPTGNINLTEIELSPGRDPLEERIDAGYFGSSEEWY